MFVHDVDKKHSLTLENRLYNVRLTPKKELWKRFGVAKTVVIQRRKIIQPVAYNAVAVRSLSPVPVEDSVVLEAEAAHGVAVVPEVEVPSAVGNPIKFIHKKNSMWDISHAIFLSVLSFILLC